MSRDDEDYFDEDTDQYEFVEDQAESDDLDVPNVEGAENIKMIRDNDLREIEIEKAQEISSRKRHLDDLYDRGDIDLGRYESLYTDQIKPLIRRARMSTALASVDLNNDDIGSLVEDKELLLADDNKLTDLKVKINEKISALGADFSQEEADRLLKEDVIGKDTHSRISRQIRINRRHSRQ